MFAFGFHAGRPWEMAHRVSVDILMRGSSGEGGGLPRRLRSNTSGTLRSLVNGPSFDDAVSRDLFFTGSTLQGSRMHSALLGSLSNPAPWGPPFEIGDTTTFEIARCGAPGKP